MCLKTHPLNQVDNTTVDEAAKVEDLLLIDSERLKRRDTISYISQVHVSRIIMALDPMVASMS